MDTTAAYSCGIEKRRPRARQGGNASRARPAAKQARGDSRGKTEEEGKAGGRGSTADGSCAALGRESAFRRAGPWGRRL